MITKDDIDKAAESYEDGLIYSGIKDQCDIQKLSKRVPTGVLIVFGMIHPLHLIQCKSV